MQQLVYFALWAALIFLMMRIGQGAHRMNPGCRSGGLGGVGGSRPRWIAPEKDTDPVCKKTIATATAKSAVHDGDVYYFCCRDCREIFEAAPDLYVGRIGTQTLEHSHV